MNSLSQLRELALNDSRRRHPTLPEAARCTRNYTDKTANGLTKCIIDFLNYSGHQAERINSTGRPIDRTKIVTDTLGFKKRIGSMQWIHGTGQKGTADISATIWGRSVKIEVKMADNQSVVQKQYQRQVEAAGGIYVIIRSFENFMNFYNGMTC